MDWTVIMSMTVAPGSDRKASGLQFTDVGAADEADVEVHYSEFRGAYARVALAQGCHVSDSDRKSCQRGELFCDLPPQTFKQNPGCVVFRLSYYTHPNIDPSSRQCNEV